MEKESLIREKLYLEGQIRSGASWFVCIAALSIVNTMIYLFGGNINFVVGLGITQLIDGYGKAFSEVMGNSLILISALIAELIIAGIFVWFGRMSKKKKSWAFIVGMIVYAMDGLIFLKYNDMLAVGFHVLALFYIYRGYTANKKLDNMLKNIEANEKAINVQQNIESLNNESI